MTIASIMACRITIPTKGAFWRYQRWPEFCKKYQAQPDAVAMLKSNKGADWRNWYVCGSEIPVTDFAAVDFALDLARRQGLNPSMAQEAGI